MFEAIDLSNHKVYLPSLQKCNGELLFSNKHSHTKADSTRYRSILSYQNEIEFSQDINVDPIRNS